MAPIRKSFGAGTSPMQDKCLSAATVPITPDSREGVPYSAVASLAAAAATSPVVSDEQDEGLFDDDYGLVNSGSFNDSARDLCEVVAVNEQAIQGWKSRLREAILAERDADIQQYDKLLSTPREELEKQGLLVTGLSMESDTLLGDVISVKLPRGAALPLHHQFKPRQNVSVLLSIAPKAAPNKDEQQTSQEETAKEIKPTVGEFRPFGGSSAFEEGAFPEISFGIDHSHDGMPVSDKRANHAELLEHMGFRKAFIATVHSVGNHEMIIFARSSGAAAMVDEAGAGDWAIMEGIQDTTYCRQMMAAKRLGKLIARKKNGINALASAVSDQEAADEARVRQILIAIQEALNSGGDMVLRDVACGTAQRLASQPVSWIREHPSLAGGALHEVKAVLLEHAERQDKTGLNKSQLDILKLAAGRTLTLLKGPPGTGKSRALIIMAMTMCRVFCESSPKPPPSLAFDIPSDQDVGNWGRDLVVKWVNSWKPEEGGAVTAEAKAFAVQTLQGKSGKALAQLNLGNIKSSHINKGGRSRSRKRAVNNDTLEQEDSRLADMHAQTLLGMRDSLLSVKKERTKLNKVARMLDRDLRILICADSNQAVDNMLKILHNTKDFIAQGYTIARLGSVGQMEDPELAHYNLDEQVKSHNLYTMYEKLWLAVLDRNLSHKELQQVANDYVESLKKIQYRLRNEAEQTTALESIRVKLAELADNCIESLIGRVPELVGLFVNSKARTEERKCNLKALKDLLRNELKPLAKYVLLIRAQVVLGTNTAAGELRNFCETLGMSFPIVILDEAGQSTEASSLIPLTLGAQWVLLGADLLQLPPTIRSNVGKRNYNYYSQAGGSLYGRLAKEIHIPEYPLHEQYRMHSKIREFIGQAFYADIHPALHESSDLDSMRPRPQPQGFRWPGNQPIAFFDFDGIETKPPTSNSYVNLGEASVCMRLLMIFARDPTVKSVAILSTYAAQAKLIGRKLAQGKRSLDCLRENGQFHAEHYGAYTIDGYQGREADVVIISPVRSNNGGRTIGHTADYRRLNVAISRARRALIVVGSSCTLGNQSKVTLDKGGSFVKNYWPDLIQWTQDCGSFVQDVNPLLATVLPPEMECTEHDASVRRGITLDDFIGNILDIL